MLFQVPLNFNLPEGSDVFKGLLGLFILTITTTAFSQNKLAIIEAHEIGLSVIRIEKIAPPLAAFSLALANATAQEVIRRVRNVELGYKAAFIHLLSLTNPAQRNILEAMIIFETLSENDKLDYMQAKSIATNLYEIHKKNLQAAANPNYVREILKPGVWRPTPPLLQPALLPNWGIVKLWSKSLNAEKLVQSLNPPVYNSDTAKMELNEVYDLGGFNSNFRTREQTDIAKFWMGSAGTVTPPGQWVVAALERIKVSNITFKNAATAMFALTRALSDAGCLAWKIKYHFDTWRPITAISHIFKDNTWKPLLINTPPFPGYISGHSTFSSAAAQVLTIMLPLNNKILSLKSEDLPNKVRNFSSYQEAAKEAGLSRIFGGIHVQADNVDGLKIGKQVACAQLLELVNYRCK